MTLYNFLLNVSALARLFKLHFFLSKSSRDSEMFCRKHSTHFFFILFSIFLAKGLYYSFNDIFEILEKKQNFLAGVSNVWTDYLLNICTYIWEKDKTVESLNNPILGPRSNNLSSLPKTTRTKQTLNAFRLFGSQRRYLRERTFYWEISAIEVISGLWLNVSYVYVREMLSI